MRTKNDLSTYNQNQVVTFKDFSESDSSSSVSGGGYTVTFDLTDLTPDNNIWYAGVHFAAEGFKIIYDYSLSDSDAKFSDISKLLNVYQATYHPDVLTISDGNKIVIGNSHSYRANLHYSYHRRAYGMTDATYIDGVIAELMIYEYLYVLSFQETRYKFVINGVTIDDIPINSHDHIDDDTTLSYHSPVITLPGVTLARYYNDSVGKIANHVVVFSELNNPIIKVYN